MFNRNRKPKEEPSLTRQSWYDINDGSYYTFGFDINEVIEIRQAGERSSEVLYRNGVRSIVPTDAHRLNKLLIARNFK